MGKIITLVILAAFTLLYTKNFLPRKPQIVEKALSWLMQNISTIAVVSLIYGLFTIIMIPFTNLGTATDTVILLASTLIMIVMALPFGFERLISGYEAKINQAILKELRSMIGGIEKNEKIVGAIAVIIGFFLLFAVLYR